MKLTPKQQCFVNEYLIDLNATQAAIRAGYSKRNADKIGPELLGKTSVSAALRKAMEERSKRTNITADRVLQEYAKIAFADIKDFLRFGTEKQVIGYEEGNPILQYRQIIEMKPSDEVDGTMINEVSINDKGIFTFKLHDKKSALDSIAKHLGMFDERKAMLDMKREELEIKKREMDLKEKGDEDKPIEIVIKRKGES